ncbi:MAG: hypothetical protein M1127_01590 [Patescibacteria group bacterium]|nr:hypothetical protein [Patescibacteria group bacterium]
MVQEKTFSIMPKPKARKPFWQNFLFVFLLVLLCAGIGGYIFLSMRISSLQKSNRELDAAAKAVQKQIKTSGLEREISEIARITGDFQTIFANHKFASNFLGFLRTICHKKVQIEKVELNARDFSASMACQTENLRYLGEQVLILNNNQQIKGFEVSGVSVNEKGGVNFYVSLSFDPQVIASK